MDLCRIGAGLAQGAMAGPVKGVAHDWMITRNGISKGRIKMRDRAFLAASAMVLALAACSSEKQETAAEAPEAPAVDAVDSSQTEGSAETTDLAAVDDADASETTGDEPKPQPEESAAPSPTPSVAAKPKHAPAPTPSAAATMTQVAATVPATFTQRCAVCHNAEKGGEDKLGPNLYGVYGHKMGQGSFSFSEALKASGLTMDDATLDKWLENPRALVPGNRMSFPGLKDAAKRKEIIAYLKQQS